MSDVKEVHTSPAEILGDHVEVAKDAISAPLPGGSSESKPSESQKSEEPKSDKSDKSDKAK